MTWPIYKFRLDIALRSWLKFKRKEILFY